MKKTLIGTTLLVGATLILTGCNQSTSSSTNSGSTTTNPITDFTDYTDTTTNTTDNTTTTTSSCLYGSGYESGIADSGQTIDYYRLNSPIPTAHGANQGVVVFSTETDLPTYNQNIFYSDSRLNVRVIPKYKYGGVDSKGVACGFSTPQQFTKMKLGVVVRSRQSSSGIGDYREFSDVDVNCPSRVHQFQVPSTSDPLVIEVMNVQWDWSCINYANQGYPNQPGYCPYANVWSTECYSFEIQFSTDTTKDLPGTRY